MGTNFLEIFTPSLFMFLFFKTDLIIDSVFSNLLLAIFIAIISCFDTFL